MRTEINIVSSPEHNTKANMEIFQKVFLDTFGN